MQLHSRLAGRILLWHVMIAFVCPWPLLARFAVVQSKEGKIYHGHIRLSTNGVTILNAAASPSVVTLGLTNLSDLFFDPAATPEPDWLTPRQRATPPIEEWKTEDIGYANKAGSLTVASGLFRVRTVGTNIAGRSDAFHFVFRPSDGNCEIVARVVNVQPRGSSTAGVMIRERLSPDSPNVFLGVAGGDGGAWQHRDDSGGETSVEVDPELFIPHWLRLKRSGNTFTASVSRNGSHWIRRHSVELPMSREVWIGLAAAAGQEQIAGVATIDNVGQDVAVPRTSFIPQLHLLSGSVVTGPILSGDASAFSVPSFPFTVPASSISHVLFHWLPFRYNGQIRAGTPGLILAGTEFVEGDLTRLKPDILTLSSVLYGLKSFDAESDLLALVLRRPFTEAAARYTLVTVNGSTLKASNLQFGDFEISFNEESLGPCTVSMPEVLWLRAAP